MICGSVIIEDSIIQFSWEDGMFRFTACDAPTGRQYGMMASPDQFVKALAMALHPNPDETIPFSWWNQAEEIMEPKDEAGNGVRWIP